MLNLHERWLLRRVGLVGNRRSELLDAVAEDHRGRGDVDVAAQLPGIELAKGTVVRDLPEWFDRLLDVDGIAHVVYGHRSYRRQVILAAALHQAGIGPERYRGARTARLHRLQEIRSTQLG